MSLLAPTVCGGKRDFCRLKSPNWGSKVCKYGVPSPQAYRLVVNLAKGEFMHTVRRVISTTGATLFVLLMSACGTSPVVQLNEPTRSSTALDVANLLPPRNIPYETVEKGGISLGYNLFFAKGGNLSGYRLTLVIRNNTSARRLLEPAVSLQDAGGFLVPPYAYQAFVTEAALLAGTAVPAIPVQAQSNYYNTGTIRNTTTGNTYAYSGTTTVAPAGGFAGGFAQGMAQGAAIRARNDREEGHKMLRWANAFWLKSAYDLPPGTAASGSLFFPASNLGQLPLRLTIETGGEKFQFVTAAK